MRSRFARTLDPHTVEAAREDGAEETTASVYSFLLTYTRPNLPHRRKLYVIGTLIAFARKEEACVSELPRLGQHTHQRWRLISNKGPRTVAPVKEDTVTFEDRALDKSRGRAPPVAQRIGCSL